MQDSFGRDRAPPGPSAPRRRSTSPGRRRRARDRSPSPPGRHRERRSSPPRSRSPSARRHRHRGGPGRSRSRSRERGERESESKRRERTAEQGPRAGLAGSGKDSLAGDRERLANRAGEEEKREGQSKPADHDQASEDGARERSSRSRKRKKDSKQKRSKSEGKKRKKKKRKRHHSKKRSRSSSDSSSGSDSSNSSSSSSRHDARKKPPHQELESTSQFKPQDVRAEMPQSIPGTGTLTSTREVVKGLGTRFKSEIQPRDAIIVRQGKPDEEFRIVRFVLSDHSLSLSQPFSTDIISPIAFQIVPNPHRSHYAPFAHATVSSSSSGADASIPSHQTQGLTREELLDMRAKTKTDRMC